MTTMYGVWHEGDGWGDDGYGPTCDDEDMTTGLEVKCADCNKILRTADGKDVEDIHTASDLEDVCESCCDVCSAEEAAVAYVPFQSAPNHELLPAWQRDDYIGD